MSLICRTRVPLATLLLAMALCTMAQAQSWPSKPVRFLLSQPPGTGPDIISRLFADRLTPIWSQQVIVENRAGGNNIIGAQAAARMPADGYNYFFATTAATV